MTNITRWSPDTCGCVIEYSWDRDTDDKDRQHTLHNIVKKCEAHDNSSGEELYVNVKDENVRKNKTLGIIAKNVPEFAKPVLERGQKVGDVLDEESDIEWSFDEQRILHIKSVSMKETSKQLLRAQFASKLGTGKVIIE